MSGWLLTDGEMHQYLDWEMTAFPVKVTQILGKEHYDLCRAQARKIVIWIEEHREFGEELPIPEHDWYKLLEELGIEQ